MALEDTTLWIWGTTGLIWLLFLWRRHPIFSILGDLLLIAVGVSSYLALDVQYPWGLIIAFIGIVDGLRNLTGLLGGAISGKTTRSERY